MGNLLKVQCSSFITITNIVSCLEENFQQNFKILPANRYNICRRLEQFLSRFERWACLDEIVSCLQRQLTSVTGQLKLFITPAFQQFAVKILENLWYSWEEQATANKLGSRQSPALLGDYLSAYRAVVPAAEALRKETTDKQLACVFHQLRSWNSSPCYIFINCLLAVPWLCPSKKIYAHTVLWLCLWKEKQHENTFWNVRIWNTECHCFVPEKDNECHKIYCRNFKGVTYVNRPQEIRKI